MKMTTTQIKEAIDKLWTDEDWITFPENAYQAFNHISYFKNDDSFWDEHFDSHKKVAQAVYYSASNKFSITDDYIKFNPNGDGLISASYDEAVEDIKNYGLDIAEWISDNMEEARDALPSFDAIQTYLNEQVE